MILGPILWLIFIGVCIVGWFAVQFARVMEWVAWGLLLFLCTQVSFAEERKSQLVIITRDDFISEGELVDHADCLKAGADRMRDADDNVIGFLCEPEVIIAICVDPVENCA